MPRSTPPGRHPPKTIAPRRSRWPGPSPADTASDERGALPGLGARAPAYAQPHLEPRRAWHSSARGRRIAAHPAAPAWPGAVRDPQPGTLAHRLLYGLRSRDRPCADGLRLKTTRSRLRRRGAGTVLVGARAAGGPPRPPPRAFHRGAAVPGDTRLPPTSTLAYPSA